MLSLEFLSHKLLRSPCELRSPWSPLKSGPLKAAFVVDSIVFPYFCCFPPLGTAWACINGRLPDRLETRNRSSAALGRHPHLLLGTHGVVPACKADDAGWLSVLLNSRCAMRTA